MARIETQGDNRGGVLNYKSLLWGHIYINNLNEVYI